MRRVQDRFAKELLLEYCKALDIRPLDGDFFRAESALVERTDALPATDRELSLLEARRWLELEPE